MELKSINQAKPILDSEVIVAKICLNIANIYDIRTTSWRSKEGIFLCVEYAAIQINPINESYNLQLTMVIDTFSNQKITENLADNLTRQQLRAVLAFIAVFLPKSCLSEQQINDFLLN